MKLHKCDESKRNARDKEELKPEISTCGTCKKSWCSRCCPTPSSLCPFCNGDEKNGKANQIGKKQLRDTG
jgi:hypothetical protein